MLTAAAVSARRRPLSVHQHRNLRGTYARSVMFQRSFRAKAMASVRATVHVARPVVAPIAQFLVHVVFTSIAFTLAAGEFAIAVLTLRRTRRAKTFNTTVSTPGTLVVAEIFITLVAHRLSNNTNKTSAMCAYLFHVAPRMHVARNLALAA